MKDEIRIWLGAQFGDDPTLHEELYGQYVGDMRAQLDCLSASLLRGDAADVGERAHAMKGMGLQMGDQDTAQACLSLQVAGRSSDLSACEALIGPVRAFVVAL